MIIKIFRHFQFWGREVRKLTLLENSYNGGCIRSRRALQGAASAGVSSTSAYRSTVAEASPPLVRLYDLDGGWISQHFAS